MNQNWKVFFLRYPELTQICTKTKGFPALVESVTEIGTEIGGEIARDRSLRRPTACLELSDSKYLPVLVFVLHIVLHISLTSFYNYICVCLILV